jgi:hypothetical protein
MTKNTEVATRDEAEVAALSPEEEALIQANQAEANPDEFTIPLLKVAQPLTQEVSDGLASPGDFVLALTGESFGDEIEFIVAGKSKGRFKPADKKDRDSRTLVADGPICPWPQDPHFGEPFSEHPDAQEKYSERVNAGQQEWGSGPPIQTTANYTGFVVGSDVPVRLSVRQTNKHANAVVKKWNTILDAVMRGKFWDSVFTLTTSQEQNASGDRYYVLNVKQGRKSTPEERAEAVRLATVLRSNTNVRVTGDVDDKPAGEAPDAAGGAAV